MFAGNSLLHPFGSSMKIKSISGVKIALSIAGVVQLAIEALFVLLRLTLLHFQKLCKNKLSGVV
jgi:hypothetical protein